MARRLRIVRRDLLGPLEEGKKVFWSSHLRKLSLKCPPSIWHRKTNCVLFTNVLIVYLKNSDPWPGIGHLNRKTKRTYHPSFARYSANSFLLETHFSAHASCMRCIPLISRCVNWKSPPSLLSQRFSHIQLHSGKRLGTWDRGEILLDNLGLPRKGMKCPICLDSSPLFCMRSATEDIERGGE